MYKSILFLMSMALLFVVNAQFPEPALTDIVQPGCTIHLHDSMCVGADSAVAIRYRTGGKAVARGIMSRPGCDTGVIAWINYLGDPATLWTPIKIPYPGEWFGVGEFNRIKKVGTSVSLCSLIVAPKVYKQEQ
jgi:hypothetical protein